MSLYLLSLVVLMTVMPSSTGLQCYRCANNDNNWKDCTDTSMIQNCRDFQDACVSFTSFYLFIQYDPRGERWHNISKGCDSLDACQRRAAGVNADLCRRSSYKEWACIDCCTGDLCNYFVTLGSEGMHRTSIIIITTFLASLFLILLQ